MGSHPKYGLSGCFEGPEATASFAFLGSWSRIFNQPTLEAQPLREASKHFWEIWMEWGSNLSLFFFKEQLRKLIFGKNWDFHNLFTLNILSGWPCMLTRACIPGQVPRPTWEVGWGTQTSLFAFLTTSTMWTRSKWKCAQINLFLATACTGLSFGHFVPDIRCQ